MDISQINWMERLSDEDQSFLKRFVLCSGSLKQLATEYGVSYPTIRLRLDRLIEKIRIYDNEQVSTHLERELRASFADGKLDHLTFKRLLNAHRRDHFNTTGES